MILQTLKREEKEKEKMKKVLSLSLTFLLVFSTLSVLMSVQPVSAISNQYFIYSRFDPPGIGDVTGVGGYVEYYGVPEWGDEIQYVYFLSGYTGYKLKVWTTDGDGDGMIEPRQHPNHYIADFIGPIEPRHFQIVSSAYLDGRTYGSSGHTEEFYVDSSGVYLGAYPYGINKWDHNWNYIGKIANSPPERTESMAYNPAENIWYAGGRYRTIYQLKDSDKDGSFLDESWQAIFTYPSYGGDHHDGMEYVGGYLWISDMTSDVIGKWQYNSATNTWQELARFTYTEAADVEGMGFGPNDHFWVGSGWGTGSYIYELGNEITKGYPIADAGDDVNNHPPTIPLKFDASESHHTDPAKNIVLYEWDFESDGIWDYSFGSFVYPTGLTPTAPGGERYYGYDGAVTYYDYAGWLARGDKGDYASGSYHIGQDIQANVGVNVYSIGDGYVTSISGPGYEHGWDKNVGDNNLGIVVRHKLDDGSEFLALYGHVHSSVSVGQHLKSGEPFATIGPYGSEPHLHFGIHPGLSMPGTNWGLMPISSWPDANAHPGDPNGPDTNGFVDPIEWITTHKSFVPVAQVEHAYPAYHNPDGSIDWSKTAKDYTASLRVTDDSDPALRDTDTRIIHITAPPWKPVADPDGPYTGYEKVPVKLDGSKSYDPESKMFPTDHPWYETLAKYEWDLDNDGQFDDATGINPEFTWNTQGLYTIALRVTDSQPSGPGGTLGPLDVDTKYTTVVIKSGVSLNVALVPTDTSSDAIQHDVSYFRDLGDKLRDYFSEASYGFLNLNVQVYTMSDGSRFSVSQSTDWYRQSAQREESFIVDSIASSDSAINFKSYDYGDEEGKGIAVFIPRNYLFYAPAFFKNNGLRGQWSTGDGVNIDAIIVPELRFQDNLEIVRGLAHEVGHWIGKVLVTTSWWPGWSKDGSWSLPDLYLMGNVDQRWDLMGEWKADDIEAVHLSSYSKEWLGWLRYSEMSQGNSYTITSLTTLNYRDTVYRYTYRKPWWEAEPHYNILEVRTNYPTYSSWDRETLNDKVLAFYEVDQRLLQQDTINLVRTLTSAPSEFQDPDAGVTYKLSSLDRTSAQVSVEKYKAKDLKGASLITFANVLSAVQSIIPHEAASPLNLPDIDLHAYASDGRHIGVNYETGEYEMQIPGAIVSGDLLNGREWIFVPEDIDVHFAVSAKDNAAFLDSFPEASELTNGIETYTISIVYYDPNENRYESSPVTQEIMPGQENIHRFAIISNPDGTYTPVIDDTSPLLSVETPGESDALQDGVTFKAHVWDENGVSSVTFSIREPNGEQGTPISPAYEYMPATLSTDDRWIRSFDTTLLPDGYYVAYVEATDKAGNRANETVNFSIRNWAPIELLPASETNKAGRTMPVKFSIRVVASVDPAQPFIHNEELTIKIYRKGYPGTILQTSTYGTTSTDYRIDSVGELYITNFKTLSTPATYVVEIYRKGMLIGTFEFKTVK